MGEAAQRIIRGEKLAIPADCPQVLCHILMQCWELDPSKRPEFTQICDMLQHLENAKVRRMVSEKRLSRLMTTEKRKSQSYLHSNMVKDISLPDKISTESTGNNDEALYANEVLVQRPSTTQYSLPFAFDSEE